MNQKNNMICDLETGVCGVAEDDSMEIIDFNESKEMIDLYYVTDPICSHCWALEPVLKKFIEQYGQHLNIHTVMGGLLPNWDGFADVSNGIGSPADVAGHWREVGEYSRMPIDGTVWLDNPLHSSFPPSRVYKIIETIEKDLANVFLRRAREALFAFNQNIADDQTLIEIVNKIGLDGETIVKEASQPQGEQLLQQDFALARNLGVRGFPTIIMVNSENKGVKIVGSRPLENYVTGLEKILSEIESKPQPSLAALLEKETLLFSKEIEVMYDLEQCQVIPFIEKELKPGAYQIKEVLNEIYIEKTN